MWHSIFSYLDYLLYITLNNDVPWNILVTSEAIHIKHQTIIVEATDTCNSSAQTRHNFICETGYGDRKY
jgi:hypothetical protein